MENAVPKTEQQIPRAMQPLSDDELQDLYEFLLAEELSEATMTLDVLDGYLTALVIGPAPVPMQEWLPQVWGPDPSHVPVFEAPEHAQMVVELMLRHRNGIVAHFIDEPEHFEPLLSFSEDEQGVEHVDGEAWSVGFLHGMEMREAAWQPLLDDPRASRWLRPMQLLGTEDLAPADQALAQTPAQREALSREIGASLQEIFRYWAPHPALEPQLLAAATVQRNEAKVGRNDPCACGSGKKFKKCCGAAQA